MKAVTYQERVNDQWIPGGKTSGGTLEATVDQIQPGTYVVSKVY